MIDRDFHKAGALRVALIGNMNNSNFAMMRYLRDLGIDAHLLRYNDEAAHFFPEHDTWEWGKWAPYIRTLPFSNGGVDSMFLKRANLLKELDGFDLYIGNGIAPVLFRKMDRILDLFIPYGDGVEFIIEHYFRWKHPRSSVVSLLRKYLMEDALKHAVKAVVTANLHSHSQNTYKRLKLNTINMPILPLYIEPRPKIVSFPQSVRDAISRMHGSNPVVFSHVSHIWKNLPVPHFMGGLGKRNNWLVQGFAQYVREASNAKALLCLFDYGRDVAETKSFTEELKIEKQVVWFPKMSRREIMCLLPYVDLGGGEFAGMYWGGCGWEFLANGVPMLHQLSNPGQYETEIPLPPFFNVQSPTEICEVLLENNRESLREKGAACRRWFNTYQGYSLAKRYVELIAQTRN
jgi:hypothetical protein